MEAVATNPDNFALEPTPTRKKDVLSLAVVPMPPGPSQKEGTTNRLKISVSYVKDGVGRNGPRGIYLHLMGSTFDGVFESFLLYSDPSHYHLLEECSRFSKKKLEAAAKRACTDPDVLTFIHDKVDEARVHYANKAR